MTSVAREEIPRSPVFNAVSAGLLLLSAGWALFIVGTPQGPMDMMVPWARGVNLLQAMLGGACVALIWLRKGWAFYVYVGLIMFGVLVGLILRFPIPYLAIGPVLLGLYMWALHSGSPSMWIQLFGRPGAPGRSMAYGNAPAMPPMRPNIASPSSPPLPPVPTAPRAAPAALRAPLAATAMDPIEALKRLGALRVSGAITEAEFAAKKAELLQRL